MKLILQSELGRMEAFLCPGLSCSPQLQPGASSTHLHPPPPALNWGQTADLTSNGFQACSRTFPEAQQPFPAEPWELPQSDLQKMILYVCSGVQQPANRRHTPEITPTACFIAPLSAPSDLTTLISAVASFLLLTSDVSQVKKTW